MQMKRIAELALTAGLFGLVGCAGPQMMVNKQAPDFTLKDLDGNDVSLHEFRGKPVLVAFWSPG
jgi:cytochrome oxidase Cu insertion factor (SCO1/SenC/PrrC family)